MEERVFCLIPRPQRFEEGSGRCVLRDGLSIVVSHKAERGEWIAARSVQRVLQTQGLAVPIQPQRLCPDTTNTIVLAVRGRDDAIFPSAVSLLMKNEQSVEGTADSSEGYTLSVEEGGIALWGASPAGLARGVQTLSQALVQARDGGLPVFRVEDTPAFRWRGIMLDVSRGKVPTLDTLRRIVDVISSFKMNVLQLYVEHTFAFRRHSDIGRGWGALTPEEIANLDAYCRDRYVELMPCLQSFGHLRRILELPAYVELAESEARWSLTPVREETYSFLTDLYADYLAAFSSPYLNVCSDETYDLGTGQSREVAERVGRGRLFLDHILRLYELATAQGRTMMVWDDMFLHYPELLPELPRDSILLNWWYEAMEHYPQVDVVHQAGLPQVVCPGTSSWNTLFPRLDNARANIRAMAADGRGVGALGVLTTDWGDKGHPNLLGNSWYGYAYGASESWSPSHMDDAEFERCFARFLFGEEATPALEAMRALTEASSLPGLEMGNGSRNLWMFFGDPLVGPPIELTEEQLEFQREMLRAHGMEVPDLSLEDMRRANDRPVPEETLDRMEELARGALERLSTLCGVTPEAAMTLDEMRLAARQVLHAAIKTRLGRRVAAGPDDVERAELTAQLALLKRDLHDLRREYERVWLARNKPEGITLTLDRFDLSARIIDGWAAQVQPHYGWGQ